MPWDEHDVTGSVSPLLPNVRMRIVDDVENDVAEGEEGEFIMKGPMVTKGILGQRKANKRIFHEGWMVQDWGRRLVQRQKILHRR